MSFMVSATVYSITVPVSGQVTNELMAAIEQMHLAKERLLYTQVRGK